MCVCVCISQEIKKSVSNRARGTSYREQITPSSKELRLRNISSSSVCVCHIDNTRPDWRINRAHMWDSPSPHTNTPRHNSKILSWICAHHSVFLTVRSFPRSEPQSHLGEDLWGGTPHPSDATQSQLDWVQALFQTRHPLNQGITVIQLSDNSISFYLPLSLSFTLHISETDVINIDPVIVYRHFISMYIRLKCLTAKTLYI